MSAPNGPHLQHLHDAARKHRHITSQHAAAVLAAVDKAAHDAATRPPTSPPTPSPGK